MIGISRTCIVEETRGAYLIELAIGLPLFFGLVLGVFDLARIVSGYSTVRSAVETGARRGVSTAREQWEIFDAFPWDMDQKVNVTEFAGVAIDPSRSARVGLRSAGKSGSWYNCMIFDGGTAGDYCDASQVDLGLSPMYSVEVRSIVIANAIMERNLGNAKFPCSAEHTEGEPGCFRCFTLRNTERFRDTYLKPPSMRSWDTKALGLFCEYDVPINVASVFLGWLPEYITVRSEMYVTIDDYPDRMYSPSIL